VSKLLPPDRVLADKELLGAALGDQSTWRTWFAILKAIYAQPLNTEDREIFNTVAGGRSPPTRRVREGWIIAGRRSAKSRMAAAIGLHSALFVKHKLSPGEVGMVLLLAASQSQAKMVFNYVKGFLNASPILKGEVVGSTQNEITLRNGIVVAVHSNSFRTVRGRTLVAAVFDEIAYWRDETSAIPDIETYRAVLPSLATTNGILIAISSPYRKLGLLHQKYRDNFGINSDDVLVVQGPTKLFNPTISDEVIAAQSQDDPTSASSEWGAEFRSDISTFLDDELIDAAIEHGRPLELPPRQFPAFYRAFTDAAGGTGKDSYTLAIAHQEAEHYVVDLVRGTHGKFDPMQVTREYAALLKEYRIGSVVGDNYAAQWTAGAWTDCDISYVRSDIPKSQIYLESLPLFTRGLVRLPDHARLLKELRLLERQTHRGGKDSVDHPRGHHDDYANSVCGVLRTLSNYLGFDLNKMLDDGEETTQARQLSEADQWHQFRLHQYMRANGVWI
jgi:Phage Terminase